MSNNSSYAVCNGHGSIFCIVHDERLVAAVVWSALHVTSEAVYVDCGQHGPTQHPASWRVDLVDDPLRPQWERLVDAVAESRISAHLVQAHRILVGFAERHPVTPFGIEG